MTPLSWQVVILALTVWAEGTLLCVWQARREALAARVERVRRRLRLVEP